MLGTDGGLDAFMAMDEDGADYTGRQSSAKARSSKQRAAAAGPTSFSDAAALFAVKPGAGAQGVHSDSDDSVVGASAKQHNPYNAADSSGADSDVAVNRSSAAKAASRTVAKQRSGKHSRKSAEDQIDDLLMSSDDDDVSATSSTSRRRRALSSSSSKKRAAAGQTAGLQQQQSAPVALAVGMAVEARFGGRVSFDCTLHSTAVVINPLT
jgi:hypothetical protein